MHEVAIVGDGTTIFWQERGGVGSPHPGRGRLSLMGGAKAHQAGRSGGQPGPRHRGRLTASKAADDLRGAEHAEDFDDPGDLVEQVARPVVISGLGRDHGRQEAGVDLFEPKRKLDDPLRCEHL